MFSAGSTSFNDLLSFPLSITFFVFMHLFWSQTSTRFSQLTHLLICLSLETLRSIVRTGLSILVELIYLVNSVIVFLSQVTLLRWLTLLLGPLFVALSVLFSWIFFFSDPNVCSTMTFCLFGNSDHAVVSVSTDFPSNSKGMPHLIEYPMTISCWLRWSLWSFEKCSLGGFL